MKTRLVVVMLGISILFFGCSQLDSSAEAPGSGVEVSEPTEVQELAEVISTSTPWTNGSKETEPVETEATDEVSQLPEPTPVPCTGVLTSPNQEGPFYSPGSPERSTLIEEGMAGIPVLIFGRVFDQECNPIPRAKLEFWLADVNGEYDNVGYRLRGHVYSDAQGNYTLESIEPTAYTGRPPHIHVKVFSPDGAELLTTQMYFAGSEASADVSSAPDLLVTYLELDESGQQRVIFNFVVED